MNASAATMTARVIAFVTAGRSARDWRTLTDSPNVATRSIDGAAIMRTPPAAHKAARPPRPARFARPATLSDARLSRID